MELADAFGSVLKKYRTKANLTQEKLAEHCKIERTFISMLERGERRPSLSMVFELANVLKVSPTRIVKEVEKLLNDEV